MNELILKNISKDKDRTIKIEVDRNSLKFPLSNLAVRDIDGEAYEVSFKKFTHERPVASSDKFSIYLPYAVDEITSESYLLPTKLLIGSMFLTIERDTDLDQLARQIEEEVPFLSVTTDNGFKITHNDLLEDPILFTIFVTPKSDGASVEFDGEEIFLKNSPLGSTFLLTSLLDCKLSNENSAVIATNYTLQPGDWVLKNLVTEEVLVSGTITSEDISNYNTLSLVCDSINEANIPIKADLVEIYSYYSTILLYNTSESDSYILSFSLNNVYSYGLDYTAGVSSNNTTIVLEDGSLAFCLKSLSSYHLLYDNFKNETKISLKNTFFQYTDVKPILIGFTFSYLDENQEPYETIVNYIYLDYYDFVSEFGFSSSKILERLSQDFSYLPTSFVKPEELEEDFEEADYKDDIYLEISSNSPSESPYRKSQGPFKVQFIPTTSQVFSEYYFEDHYDWVGLNYPTEEDQIDLILYTPTINI